MPISETLNSLFVKKSFENLFLSTFDLKCVNDIYNKFCCGSNFKSNNLLKENENFIHIQLFYDDFEVVNLLGSKTSIHKIGAIYFTIRNLPFELNCHVDNIHLVALFYVQDLKNEFININDVLRPIYEDLKQIEEIGIKVNESIIKGTL